MKIVGITGGIGSGKSTVCRIFSALGIPVFNADEEAKTLYADRNVREQVTALLGPGAYKDGRLDRAAVAKKVFSDKQLLSRLNAIIHPAVQHRFAEWCKGFSASPYVLKEAAILFESGTDKDTDAVITVVAPKAVKVARVMQRDQVSSEEVEKRMKSQWSDEEKTGRSAFVIHNDEQQLLIPQVLKVHQALLSA
jgi:dephospho-CoA kinase